MNLTPFQWAVIFFGVVNTIAAIWLAVYAYRLVKTFKNRKDDDE